MKINIVLPYEDVKKNIYIWANEEKHIDFRKEYQRAERCTVCFAATELEKYLRELGAYVFFSDKTEDTLFNIVLMPEKTYSDNDTFFIEPKKNGIKISSGSRTGILYGVYRLLKMQGIRWLNPDCDIIPDIKIDKLNIPAEKEKYMSDMPLGRGFDFEGALKDSTKLWLWMARNELNLSTYRPYTAAFQRKLGMIFKMGGHIFEDILDPDRIGKEGKTFWDTHNDWYGTGETKTKETALNTQFCMSNRDLLNFLSSEILNRINNEWYEADRIDVWGFDTWGKTCNCDNCKKIGNSTDRTLYFISYIRDYLDKAKINGTLDHDVSLIMCSYEGTDTLLPPEKDIPENFIKGKDYITFYPILRCYKHNISDKSCSENSKYMRCLKGWGNIPIMLGEYYNVSKFEDLPFLFTKTMQKDFLTYRKNGVAGMSYMHIPMMEWGVRNLTQSLFAALCNNISLNIDKFKECYFCDRYGIYSEDAKKAYTLCEKASEYASSWRSWGENCILSVLNAWDGSKPIKELYQDEHFNGNVVETGEKCIENYKTAAGIMRGCLGRRNAEVAEKINIAEYCIVNPVQQQNTARDFITAHIEEDIRLLMYGHDVMNLTVLFIKYYNALLKNEDGDAVWYEIDTVSEDMAERYMPMTYINSEKTIELTCKDMFERSQLHTLYYKCLKYRLYTNLKVKE